jgi:hypothetical protein
VQADNNDRLALPAGAPTLDCTEWVKDPGLESGFDPILDQIQHLAENGVNDRPARLAWMYTGVNDIMQLERGPGSSLDKALLDACLKVLVVDRILADLMVPTAVCESICVNQAARIALLATMPTLDDVNITPV